MIDECHRCKEDMGRGVHSSDDDLELLCFDCYLDWLT
jgi:hypothetical protein